MWTAEVQTEVQTLEAEKKEAEVQTLEAKAKREAEVQTQRAIAKYTDVTTAKLRQTRDTVSLDMDTKFKEGQGKSSEGSESSRCWVVATENVAENVATDSSDSGACVSHDG